jgi:hypothetical protein
VRMDLLLVRVGGRWVVVTSVSVAWVCVGIILGEDNTCFVCIIIS